MAKKKWINFNRNSHPERQPNEVFIANALDGTGEDGYDLIRWATKRKGKTAYDVHGIPLGERLPQGFPVFVKQSEILAEDPKTLKELMPISEKLQTKGGYNDTAKR